MIESIGAQLIYLDIPCLNKIRGADIHPMISITIFLFPTKEFGPIWKKIYIKNHCFSCHDNGRALTHSKVRSMLKYKYLFWKENCVKIMEKEKRILKNIQKKFRMSSI